MRVKDRCLRHARSERASPVLQILIAVHGTEITLRSPGLGIDMVTSADAPKRPTVRLNQPAHLLPGDRSQTATSRI